MDPKPILEAVLFVAEEPVTEAELAEVLEIPRRDVGDAIRELESDLRQSDRGVTLRQVAGGWRMYTVPEAHPYLERFAATEKATRLSNAALETLAVVAYRQPVSRGQISEVRGVDSERALHTLERRGLVVAVGRASGPGQAVLYGTTPLFLERLGLDGIDGLPPLADHVPSADIVETLERPFRPEASSSDSRS